MYCGDETGAFIGDVGSHTARFGYGGEDCPKVVVPSAVYRRSSEVDDGRGRRGRPTNNGRDARGKYSAPVSLMRAPPDDCFSTGDDDEGGGGGGGGGLGFVPIYSYLDNPNSDRRAGPGRGDIAADIGAIEDVDAWATLWEYSYRALCVRGRGKHTTGHKYRAGTDLRPEEAARCSSSRSRGMISSAQSEIDGPIDHPLLAVDSTGRTASAKAQQEQRADMLEALFESLSAPAAYIAPSPMLSSFAYGRQTSLVIDIGHSGSKVTPVVDGYCLSHGHVSSGRGGAWLCNVQKSVLGGVWDEIGTPTKRWNGWGRGSGGTGEPPCRDEGIVPRYLLHPTMSPNKYSDRKLKLLKQSSFHSMAIHEELLFSDTLPYFCNNYQTGHMLPLQKLVHESLTQVLDADLRKELSSNIILTGGASLFPSLEKRLSIELGEVLPSPYKYKVTASKNSVENRYSAWIGGSILSSLGSFQQLWLSRREYEECGPLLGLQRFKN
ncbi:hypothetical protein ACHAW5_009887 [Stephanodiscus triporus]|uniref:Actin n=1 Tax=Stephanodiscus triporus TaxID=2934178 RepID=A0ABD3Q2R2_9STRA